MYTWLPTSLLRDIERHDDSFVGNVGVALIPSVSRCVTCVHRRAAPTNFNARLRGNPGPSSFAWHKLRVISRSGEDQMFREIKRGVEWWQTLASTNFKPELDRTWYSCTAASNPCATSIFTKTKSQANWRQKRGPRRCSRGAFRGSVSKLVKVAHLAVSAATQLRSAIRRRWGNVVYDDASRDAFRSFRPVAHEGQVHSGVALRFDADANRTFDLWPWWPTKDMFLKRTCFSEKTRSPPLHNSEFVRFLGDRRQPIVCFLLISANNYAKMGAMRVLVEHQWERNLASGTGFRIPHVT